MKKTVLVLAALSTSAGAAFSQSSVTVYGVVDTAIARTNNGSTVTTSLDSGKQSGSRLGFLGSEDLGGGLKAVFTVENGFSADTGAQADAARLFNRQSWVGLASSFGTVKLGRQKTPVYANVS